jgi:hypothetical protein
MTTPGSTPEQGLSAGAQEPSSDELRAKVAALADQVRALANGSHPVLGDAAAVSAAQRRAAPSPQEAEGVTGAHPARSNGPQTFVRAEPGRAGEEETVARAEPGRAGAAETVAHEQPRPAQAAAAAVEEFAELSGRLLETVIDTAELAAAEIRAGAEREAADIRERADAAIGEADAALDRYREALAALAVETERIERSITALREQAHALEEERRRVDVAIDLLRRRPAR